MEGLCFITDKKCEVIEFMYDKKVFLVSEKLSEDHPVKAIKLMIAEKIDSGSKKKTELITKIEDMAKAMNISKEELLKMLGGPSTAEPEEELTTEGPAVKVEPVKVEPVKVEQKQKDDGFKEVDGGLKSVAKASLNIDSEAGEFVTPASRAYGLKTKDNKEVIETNKKVKSVDNVLISKSDMGTTAIAIAQTDSNGVNKLITAVHPQTKDLIRGAVSGGNRVGVVGSTARECPVCKGSGITQINNKVCIKCNGSGFIFA